MRFSTRSLVIASSICATAPAFAQSARVCAEVTAPDDRGADVARALADRGIPRSRDGCATVRVELTDDDVWRVTLTHGFEAVREVHTLALGAAWVDSLVRPARLGDLLEPAAQPRLPVPEKPTVDAPDGIVLYASFEAWRARRPVATVDASLSPRTVSAHLVGEEGLEPLWVIDRKKRDARSNGRIFAFEAEGEVYVHDGSPKAHKGNPYGRLVVHGERGLFQREVCHWVQTRAPTATQGGAGFVRCDVDLRMLDLETGEITPLNRKRVGELVAVDPGLEERWNAVRPKHVGVMRTYADLALAAAVR